jgi:uncharacterized repeat protein (TIGR01451 family)
MVVILGNDGITKGLTKTATVEENMIPANKITVTIFDNGAVLNDTATDGTYHGFFNVSNLATGGITNQAKGIIAVTDGKQIKVTVNLDGDPTSGTAMVTTDFMPPTVKVVSAKDVIVSGNYYLKVQSGDLNMKAVVYEVDGGSEQATTLQAGFYLATIDTKPLSEDIHSVKVTAKDVAMNENYVTFNVTADRTIPSVTIRPTPKYIVSSYLLNVTVTDLHINNTTILYRIDTDTATTLIPKAGTDTFTTTIDLSDRDEGEHTIYVQASDNADNINNTQFVKCVLDITKPAITWVTPQATAVNSVFNLNVSITDANMNTNENKYKLDGGLPNVIPGKGGGYFETDINTIPFNEGPHSVVVYVKDLAGNVNQSSPLNFIVDRTLPAINITSLTTAYCKDKYILTAEIKDANIDKIFYLKGTDKYLITDHTGNIYTKEINVSTWKEATYIIKVEAIDKATNLKDSDPINLVVDITPPAFSYTLKSTDVGFKLDVTVTDGILDPTTVFYSLDGKPKKDFDNVVSNKYMAIIAKADFTKGNHTITLFAGDKAGNSIEKTYNEALIIPPPVVTGMNIKDLYDGKIQLSWKDSTATDLDHYNVYYRAYDVITEVTGLNAAISLKANNTIITGLALQTRYYFGVTAVDKFGYENKTVTPISGTSIESPKVPSLSITLVIPNKSNNLKAGDTVTFAITVKNTGNINASTIKINVVVDNNVVNFENVEYIAPGQTKQVNIDWNAEEGTHTVNVTAIQGQQVLATKGAYQAPIVVKPSKGTTINNGGFNYYYLLAIVGVIAGVCVLAFAWRTTKKQDEEIKQEEIELGIRPDKDGKVHKPQGQGPPKPGGPEGEKPAVKRSHSPDVFIPSSPLLQQPPQQPPAAPPPQPPAQPPQQPPQQ